MKRFYCLVFSFFIFYTYSQSLLPPPGCTIFAMIDADNDGYASFNTDWFIHDYYPAYLTAQYGFDLSGYTLQWNPAIDPVYTNTVQNSEFVFIDFIYSGIGPYYDQLAIGAAYYNCVKLMALPANGDFDDDGISNADEDLNGNLNLTDDDSDNDWDANFLDSDALNVNDFKMTTIAIYPNPAENIVHFESKVKAVSVCTIDGKKIPLTLKDDSINISPLANGLYLITGQTLEGKFFKTRLIKK